MAHCPFCQAPVPTDLVTYGGPCPKCFGMIPGEEAPTDPGEVVKKALATADDKARKRRQSAPLLVAVPLVLVTVLIAVGYALWPEPEVEPIVFDGEFDIMAVPVAYLEAPAEAPVEAGKPPRPRPDPRPQAGGTAEPTVARNPQPGSAPQPAAQPRPTTGSDAVASADPGMGAGAAAGAGGAPGEASAGGSRGSGFGVDLSAKRRTGTLTDPDQIKQMVDQRMTQQAGKLKACYEQSLKADENLAGRWRIAYTVTAKGTVSNASATGLTAKNAGFETCMIDQLKRWTFDPIARDQPVQRTLYFRPQ